MANEKIPQRLKAVIERLGASDRRPRAVSSEDRAARIEGLRPRFERRPAQAVERDDRRARLEAMRKRLGR